MLFTYEELIELEEPYEQFSDDHALCENAGVLKQLNEKQQKTLAIRIIAGCPKEKLEQYASHIKALNSEESGFHSLLSEAHQVRSQIIGLLDATDQMAYTLFLEKKFDPSPFHKFSELAKEILSSDKQAAIVEQLALAIPQELHSYVARNIEIAFPSPFATKLKDCFTIYRNIELLLGDNPETFFSRDFDRDAYNKFPHMLRKLLNGQENKIGKKISNLDTAKQDSIRHQLALLCTEIFDTYNPFKCIREAMEPRIDNKTFFPTVNPHHLFSDIKKSPTGITSQIKTEQTDAQSDDKKSKPEYDKSSFSY